MYLEPFVVLFIYLVPYSAVTTNTANTVNNIDVDNDNDSHNKAFVDSRLRPRCAAYNEYFRSLSLSKIWLEP